MPKATHLISYASYSFTPAPLLAKQTTQPKRCILGNVEALARTDARSDHAVLELFCFFFLSREKRKISTICIKLTYINLINKKHSKQICSIQNIFKLPYIKSQLNLT